MQSCEPKVVADPATSYTHADLKYFRRVLQKIVAAAPSQSGDMSNLRSELSMSGDDWGALQDVLQSDVRL